MVMPQETRRRQHADPSLLLYYSFVMRLPFNDRCRWLLLLLVLPADVHWCWLAIALAWLADMKQQVFLARTSVCTPTDEAVRVHTKSNRQYLAINWRLIWQRETIQGPTSASLEAGKA